MTEVTTLNFLLLTISRWVNRRQLKVIEYLREENRVLREHLGTKRLRFTDAQRRRLGEKGKALGRRKLRELGTVVTTSLEPAPVAEARPRSIDFGRGERNSSVIPWGDLATAHWQTGIPNISVYTARPASKVMDLLFPHIQRLMSTAAVQKFARKRIEQKVTGPSEQFRKARDTYVWGEVKNASGETVTCRIRTPNGYTVTMDGILLTAAFLSRYEGQGGCLTPSQLMGSGLVERLPGATKLELAS